MVYSGNFYLNREQMKENSEYILDFFMNKGWSRNAVCGMLGNMERESTINPGIWQNLSQGNMSLGYGLVQWTPASKYINWANANGWDIGSIVGQCNRIQYELENNIQYIPTSTYPMTFQEFSKSPHTPEYLASVFLANYERAGVSAEQERRDNARYWYDVLVGGGQGGGIPHFPTTEGLAITSPYGARTHPITGLPDFHAAIDITGEGVNHPIYATQTAKVIENTWNDISGWRLRLEHEGDPYFSQYLHMAVQSPIAVGTRVIKGQVIGTMGTTGGSTGIHLDFAIATKANGFFTINGTIDPLIYLGMDFGGGDFTGNKANALMQMLLSGAMRNWDM